jgi:hypothetical protein
LGLVPFQTARRAPKPIGDLPAATNVNLFRAIFHGQSIPPGGLRSHIWQWLGTNAVQFQSLVAFSGMALTLASIWVLIVTWRAIKRQALASELQADAARALTRVAEEQTKAAIDAAESSKRQADLLSRQFELSTAPLIVGEADDRPNMKNCKIVNRGQGVAFQVFYWQGGLERAVGGVPLPISPVQPSTLAPGSCAYLPTPPAWDSWTIRYKGSDRQERWTIMYRDPNKSQEHVVREGLQQVYLA